MGKLFKHFCLLVTLVGLASCSSQSIKSAGKEKIDRRGTQRSGSDGAATGSGDVTKNDGDKADGADDAAPGVPVVDGANGSAGSIERTFLNNPEGPAEFKVQLKDDLFEQEIVLKDNLANMNQKFDQVNRPVVSDAFKQGSAGIPKIDSFTQDSGAGLLDILIVMDNSGSMGEEQAEMANRMEPLLQYVTNVDWRIGVVTTDPANPCMRAVIAKGDANASASFRSAMLAGTSGSANERAIESAVLGLNCSTNKWVRANSTIAVVIVSDEDNCSTGSGCGANYQYTPNYFLSFLTGLGKTPGVDARVYGIFWQPGTTCSTGAYQANQYAQLVNATSGVSGSICAASYAPVLQSISQNIAQILKTQFQLSSVPDAGSLSVTVNGQPWAGSYTIASNVITFVGQVPPPGSSIKVSYKSGSQVQLSSFMLSATPAANTVSVKVNGVEQATNTYTIDYATRVLKFNTAPAPDANIAVSYRTNVALQTDFSIGTDLLPATIKVFVDGVQVSNFSYIAASGVIRFAQAPVDGAKISVDYVRNLGPVLVYPFTPVGNNIRDLSAVDKATNVAVSITRQGNTIVVPANEVKAGRVVLVRYRSEASNNMDVELPFDPIDGTLVVEEAPAGCSLNNGISHNGKILHVQCGLPGVVRVSFKHAVPPQQEYSMDEVKSPEKGKWDVYVNGDLSTDYTRQGSKIIFNGPLPMGATVLIKFTYSDDI